MNESDITYGIRGAIFDTYNALGPGLLESVYEEVLIHFLEKRGLSVERQVPVSVVIEGKKLNSELKLDLLVEKKVIVEIKSVLEMKEVFHLQILTYLRLADLHRGILVNFNTEDIRNSIWSKVNGYEEK